MSDQKFDLEESDHMNGGDWQFRQHSSDLIVNSLMMVQPNQHKDLLFSNEPAISNLSKRERKKLLAKEQGAKKSGDYRKNICGYITKKIIRQFLSPNYQQKVQEICNKFGCDIKASKQYFLDKFQKVTGPSHLPSLFIAEEEWERPIKRVFRQFFLWFTKERYLRYLILQGKMQQKQAYIEYKNSVLMSILNQQEKEKECSSSSSLPSELSSI